MNIYFGLNASKTIKAITQHNQLHSKVELDLKVTVDYWDQLDTASFLFR